MQWAAGVLAGRIVHPHPVVAAGVFLILDGGILAGSEGERRVVLLGAYTGGIEKQVKMRLDGLGRGSWLWGGEIEGFGQNHEEEL